MVTVPRNRTGLVGSAAASALAFGATAGAARLLPRAAGAAATAGLAGAALGALGWLQLGHRRELGRVRRVVERSDARTARRTDSVVARSEVFSREVSARVEESEKRVLAAVAGLRTESAAASAAAPERVATMLEPMIGLMTLFEARAPLPSTRGFAAASDLVLAYVAEILRHRPSLVVECGSGTSTVFAAYALEMIGGTGKVVALEDGEKWVERTRGMIADHGLEHRAEVRHAPITDVSAGGETFPWYSTDAVEDLDGIGVLLVDGPVGNLTRHARYPAVPVLRKRLLPGAVVILDDVARQEEDEVAHRWVAEWPGLEQTRLRHEKGTALLTVPSSGG